MSKLPILNFKILHSLLLRWGFTVARQKGSHVYYVHLRWQGTCVPDHRTKDLPRKLLRTILREIKVGVDEFNEELQK